MREIKFRAWDSKNKQMREVKCIKFNWEGIPIKVNGCIDEECKPENLMQFTGLHDKNGKEIYEGDIVNEFRKSRSFPEGKNSQRIIRWQEMTLDDSYGETAVGFNLFSKNLEVIGNIYETPDLLKV